MADLFETTELEGGAVVASPNERLVSGPDLNEKLRNFGRMWEIDGDLMRCTGCGRAIIASRANDELNHAHGCRKAGYMDNRNPWLILAEWLAN